MDLVLCGNLRLDDSWLNLLQSLRQILYRVFNFGLDILLNLLNIYSTIILESFDYTQEGVFVHVLVISLVSYDHVLESSSDVVFP